jgi:hypothetical protein
VPEAKIPPTERITTSFKQLAIASSDLDLAAKELGKTISSLEAAVRRVGLELSAWHLVAGHDDPHGAYWTRDIGWTQLNGLWSIALRQTSGHNIAEQHDETIWPFEKAPRWMCVEASGKLPDLFETLVKRTRETTEKLKNRKKEADELAAAIDQILPETVDAAWTARKGKK